MRAYAVNAASRLPLSSGGLSGAGTNDLCAMGRREVAGNSLGIAGHPSRSPCRSHLPARSEPIGPCRRPDSPGVPTACKLAQGVFEGRGYQCSHSLPCRLRGGRPALDSSPAPPACRLPLLSAALHPVCGRRGVGGAGDTVLSQSLCQTIYVRREAPVCGADAEHPPSPSPPPPPVRGGAGATTHGWRVFLGGACLFSGGAVRLCGARGGSQPTRVYALTRYPTRGPRRVVHITVLTAWQAESGSLLPFLKP